MRAAPYQEPAEIPPQTRIAAAPGDDNQGSDGGGIHRQEKERVLASQLTECLAHLIREKDEKGQDTPCQAEGNEQEGQKHAERNTPPDGRRRSPSHDLPLFPVKPCVFVRHFHFSFHGRLSSRA